MGSGEGNDALDFRIRLLKQCCSVSETPNLSEAAPTPQQQTEWGACACSKEHFWELSPLLA